MFFFFFLLVAICVVLGSQDVNLLVTSKILLRPLGTVAFSKSTRKRLAPRAVPKHGKCLSNTAFVQLVRSTMAFPFGKLAHFALTQRKCASLSCASFVIQLSFSVRGTHKQRSIIVLANLHKQSIVDLAWDR